MNEEINKCLNLYERRGRKKRWSIVNDNSTYPHETIMIAQLARLAQWLDNQQLTYDPGDNTKVSFFFNKMNMCM